MPRFLVLSFLALIASGFALMGDRTPTSARVVVADGEDLEYEVSWAFVKLGTIHLKTLPDFSAQASIDSYDGLPFVDLHSVHYSEMDSLFSSIGSRSLEKREGQWWGLNYVYDPKQSRLLVQETWQKDLQSPPSRRTPKDTLYMPNMAFQDGLSIAYFPRRYIHTVQALDVPTVLYGKLGTTTFRFTGEKVNEDIDALDDPVRCIEVAGTTSVEGVFGMTGEFKGWFSDDVAAVPIKGKLKVLLGNVTLELIRWNRKGWNPPH